MFSKLRQSFRRKKSHRRHRASEGIEDVPDDFNTDKKLHRSGTLRSQKSTRTSTSNGSLNSSASYSNCYGAAKDIDLDSSQNPDTQWQRHTPSVIESNRVMFNRQLNCDVTFVVGEGEALVGAHRYVLVSRSDVFFRMFCGPLAETGLVVLPDVTEDVFRQFLEFLYVDAVTLTPDNVTLLHYLGQKYDVEPLVQQCLAFLHAQLTCHDACSILEQAHRFDERELYDTAFEFIKENVKACLDSPAVHDLCRSCLERLLALDAMEIGEFPLFKAALNWAEAALEKRDLTVDAYNVRQELGALLHLIRFPVMTLTLLKERVFPIGVLTVQETKGIMGYKDKGRHSDSLPFQCRGRQRVVQRFKNVSRVPCDANSAKTGWTAAITFHCDRDFFLHGIHVYSCTRETQQAVLQFSVLQGQEQLDVYNHNPDLHTHTYTLGADMQGVKTTAVSIAHPLPLLGHTRYTLVLSSDVAHCFAGADGVEVVSNDDAVFRFEDSDVKGNTTSVTEGQIPCLVYSVR